MHNAADRDGAVLLEEAKAEIVALRNGVNECYRMLLAEPNTKLALDRAETMLRELMQPSVAGKVTGRPLDAAGNSDELGERDGS